MIRKYIAVFMLLLAQVILLGHSVIPHHHHHTHPAGDTTHQHGSHPHQDLPQTGHDHGEQDLGGLFSYLLHADEVFFAATTRINSPEPHEGLLFIAILNTEVFRIMDAHSPPLMPPRDFVPVEDSDGKFSPAGLRAPPIATV